MGVGKSTFAFSTSSITIDGGSTTISITRDNQSYSHKLRHGFGDIATLAVGTTSYTWTPTAAQLTKFFQEVPNQKTRQIDVTLDTYNGSTLVGSDIHALTVTLSETTGKPSISGFAITDSNSTTNGWGVIVDGKSTLTVTATPTAKYGATISKNVFICTTGGKTYESYYINDLIASLPLTTTPTAFTIGYKSTDSRGFSNTVTLSKTVAKYQAPAIDTFEIIRCDTSGNESDNGTKAKVIIKGSWAAMKVGTTYKNTATLKVGYKTKAATSYTYQTISVLAGTVDVSQLLSATLTAGTDYEFSVTLTDTLSESASRSGVGFSNVGNIFYISPDGRTVTFNADTLKLGDISESSKIEMCKGKGVISVGKPEKMWGVAGSFNISGEDIVLKGTNSSRIGATNTVGHTAAWSYGVATANASSTASAISAGYEIYSACTTAMEDDGSYPLASVAATSFKVDAKGIYINGNLMADFVVAQGGSGVWTYRKWKSGIVECWGYLSVTCTANNWCTGALSYPFTINYPRFQITRSSSGEAWSSVGQAFATSTTSSITINTYQTSASSVQFHVYVKGEA